MSLIGLTQAFPHVCRHATLLHLSTLVFIHNMANGTYGCMSPACPQISLSEFSQENTCLKCQRLWKYHSVFYQVLSCQAVSNQKTDACPSSCAIHIIPPA